MTNSYHIEDDWRPTPETIDALPLPLRICIARLVEENSKLHEALQDLIVRVDLFKMAEQRYSIYTGNARAALDATKEDK